MELYYEGTDISDDVDISKCVHRDGSGGKCDLLEIEMENADAWYRWGPKRDDKIIAAMNGYQTGTLYLNAVLPENGKYRIWATSVPGSARRKSWKCYEGMKLGDILNTCAAECGMEGALYGLDTGIEYPFLLRRDESAPAFIARLMEWEGAAFKTVQGRFAGVSISYAQAMEASQSIEISADQAGVNYLRRDDMKLGGITLHTPFAESTAEDTDAPDGQHETYTHYPVRNAVQGGRWARGLLLTRNRRAETLSISSEFNAGLTALARVNIVSAADANGSWLVDEVEHDFIGGKSTAKLLRCIDTIK